MISEVQKPLFMKHYRTPEEASSAAPWQFAADRRAPPDAAQQAGRKAPCAPSSGWRKKDLLLLAGRSGFKT